MPARRLPAVLGIAFITIFLVACSQVSPSGPPPTSGTAPSGGLGEPAPAHLDAAAQLEVAGDPAATATPLPPEPPAGTPPPANAPAEAGPADPNLGQTPSGPPTEPALAAAVQAPVEPAARAIKPEAARAT
ncbi:MAG TPA: hypothetical protein VHL09_08845, partial [Dehalococcoidia bacterium]|nr:hypothetical protein [Dehalococcoidia bacterium]